MKVCHRLCCMGVSARAVMQATSNVEFVLPAAAVTAGIVSGLQFSADLTFTPWLKLDYLSNRWGASASNAGVSGMVW